MATTPTMTAFLLSGLARAAFRWQGRKALVLGSGGASRDGAARCCASTARRRWSVISRSGPDNYENLAAARGRADCRQHNAARDVPEQRPRARRPAARFRAARPCWTCVYNPARTAAACSTRSGCGIPAMQAGCRCWWRRRSGARSCSPGQRSRTGASRRSNGAVRARLENVVLIGMPGCGKSSVGAAARRAAGPRGASTCDAYIEQQAGKSDPGDLRRGRRRRRSAASRREALRELGKRSGIIHLDRRRLRHAERKLSAAAPERNDLLAAAQSMEAAERTAVRSRRRRAPRRCMPGGNRCTGGLST